MGNSINRNNLYIKIVLPFLLVFGSCQSDTKKEIGQSMFFSLYDSSQNIIEKDLYRLDEYQSTNRFDSIVIADKKNNTFNFLMYKNAGKVSIFCSGKELSVYSIEDTLIHEISNPNCNLNPPFVNKNTLYKGAKFYRINEKDYKIYHFVGDNGVDFRTYDCYFLEETGPICFYSFDSNEYLICDSLSSVQISTKDLKALTQKLITDSLFFSKFFLERHFPNFHRPNYK